MTSQLQPLPSSHSAVELVDVTKRYGPVQAVAGIDLVIAPGEIVALLGPNGAGKSTTIDLLLGLARPDSGRARLFGVEPSRAGAHGWAGAMLQAGKVPPDLTVRELVELMAGLYPKGRARALDDVMDRARIRELADRRTNVLSGGEAQRVRFALALVPDPDLLVLDEPTAAMDVESRQSFWAAMRDWAGEGRTVLFATHYLEEADEFADRVVLLRHGRVVADATPAQIRSQAGGRTIRGLIDPSPAPEQLAALPGVVRAELAGSTAILHCADSDAAVRALLAGWPDLRDLEISAPRLDEAFISLTTDQPDAAALPEAAHHQKEDVR